MFDYGVLTHTWFDVTKYTAFKCYYFSEIQKVSQNPMGLE